MKKLISLIAIFFFSIFFGSIYASNEAEKELLNSITQFYSENSKIVKTYNQEDIIEWLAPYEISAKEVYAEGKLTEEQYNEFNINVEKMKGLNGKELAEKLNIAANNLQTLMNTETAIILCASFGVAALATIGTVRYFGVKSPFVFIPFGTVLGALLIFGPLIQV